jgi:1,4-alpha-glucan branching enzyme
MKKYLLSLIFLITVQVSAQLTSVPQYPTEYDSIKIIFDASKGGRGLVGYTGVVYTHTGVITSLSNGQWSHVIGSWGNNQVQPALTRIGIDLYELKIGYPRQFYSVTNPAEQILKLAFVFRSADATRQTEDLFLTIFSSGVSIIVNNPQVNVEFGDPLRSPGFANPGDTVAINVQAVAIQTQLSSLKLYINNNLVAQTTQNELNFNFIAASYTQGAHNAMVVAADTASLADTMRFVMFVNPAVENAPLPANVKPGINIFPDYTVTLAIFAPYKKFIYVIGSFNDWKVNTSYFMKKHQVTADSVVWHITLPGMTPGSEKLFQYLVDGNIRIADPYSEKVLDPWNDQYIPGATYPNLTPYPSGKTNFPLSVFQTGLQPYQWQVTDFVSPKKTDLVIYELLIRDFLAAHDFKTLRIL